jgi:hypothetical protein
MRSSRPSANSGGPGTRNVANPITGVGALSDAKAMGKRAAAVFGDSGTIIVRGEMLVRARRELRRIADSGADVTNSECRI